MNNYKTGSKTYKGQLKEEGQSMLDELSPKQPDRSSQLNDLYGILKNNPLQKFSDNTNGSQVGLPSSFNSTPQSKILGSRTEVTQGFGNVNPGIERFSRGGVNNGTDFKADIGTPVALPEGNWKIIDAYSQDNTPGHIGDKTNSGYGNSILAQNLDTGEKLRFSHLSKVGVNPNQTIQGGSVVGATGATGNVTGPHLDLEYYNKLGQIADILKSVYGKYLQ